MAKDKLILRRTYKMPLFEGAKNKSDNKQSATINTHDVSALFELLCSSCVAHRLPPAVRTN